MNVDHRGNRRAGAVFQFLSIPVRKGWRIMNRMNRVCMCVIGVMFGSSQPAGAIIKGLTPSAEDKRFDAVGAWMLTADWQTGGNQGLNWNNERCSCVLIAPNIVMTARHCDGQGPPGMMSVRFRRNPDGSIGQINSTAPDQGASSFYHVLVDHVVFAPGVTLSSTGQTLPPEDVDLSLVFLSECVTHIDPIPVRFLSEGELELPAAVFSTGWGREEYPCGGCSPDLECCPCTSSCLTCLATALDDGPPSHRVKTCATNIVQVLEHLVTWEHVCNTVGADCGPAQHDSGGGILLPLSNCDGKFELIAIHRTHRFGWHFGLFQSNPVFPIALPCQADLSNDRTVDGLDIGVLLANWSIPGGSPGCNGATPCRSDLNCDGVVDQSLLEWLSQASYWDLVQWFLQGMPSDPAGQD